MEAVMACWEIEQSLQSLTEINGSLDQLFRNIFANEQIPEINFDEIGTIPINGNVEAAQASDSQATESRVGDEGTFLSNLLRQIMHIVSQNISETNNSAVEEAVEDRNIGVASVNAEEVKTRLKIEKRISRCCCWVANWPL